LTKSSVEAKLYPVATRQSPHLRPQLDLVTYEQHLNKIPLTCPWPSKKRTNWRIASPSWRWNNRLALLKLSKSVSLRTHMVKSLSLSWT